MPFRLDVDRLHKDELVWELKARGIAESDNVDSLRKSLRSAMAVERDASFVSTLCFEGDVSEELNICKTKLTEISKSIQTFTGTISQVRKLETKFCHLYNRLEHLRTSDDELRKQRATLLKKLMEFIEEYQSKRRNVQQVVDIPTDPRFRETLSNVLTDDSSPQPHNTSSPRNDLNRSMLNSSNLAVGGHSVPVYKWQLKFAGRPTESFNAFLEEVEEHCQSRNIDKDQLFASARDLFTGDALRMYNWLKRHVSDWNGLVRLMKEEYVPSAEKLWQQILLRTQGSTESIGLYVAIMTGLFDRMPTRVTDSLRMQVLRKNILPFYQERLALTEVNNPFELIELCRKIEEIRESVNTFKPPNLSTLTLEPDLAYAGPSKPSKPSVAEVQVIEPTCWRCRLPGHVVRDCPKKKHDFRCFGCGRDGFTKNTCPTCRPGRFSQTRNIDQRRENADRDQRRDNTNRNNRNHGNSGNGSQRR